MANESKPIPVSPSALIQVGGRNFSSMRSASDLTSLKASAPAYHDNVTRALLASGKVRDESVQQLPKRLSPVVPARKLRFEQGSVAVTTKGKRVTIIKASVGYTSKTKTPVHKVADSRGNVWEEKETNLKLKI